MGETAERITLARAKGSNTWEVMHERFLEETRVKFQIVEGASALGIVMESADRANDRPLVGRAIRQLELIVQASNE